MSITFLRRGCVPALLALQACSSSSSSSSSPPASAETPDASAGDGSTAGDDPIVATPDLGKSCGAGCGGSQICTATDTTCSSGHCLFDGRDTATESYCTADCSAASCPTGFACIEVPSELKRACARDRAVKQGGPSVRGTIKLTGALGTTGSTPTDFTVNQALDAPPAVKLESLQCGEAFITTPSTSDNALFLYAKACGSSTSTTLTFYVPLEVGSYPTKNPKFPIVSAALGPRFSATEVQYGSSKKAAAGTLTISDVSGVAKTTTPWTVEHLKVTYVGSLPKSVDCTGPSCANGGPTLDVDLNLELSKVSTK